MAIKPLKDMTFDELIEENVNKTLTKFVESGGNGLKSGIVVTMSTAIDWYLKDKGDRVKELEDTIRERMEVLNKAGFATDGFWKPLKDILNKG